MATVYYPAIVERGPEGYGVFFPDLPGCVSAGQSVQAAALGAEEALNAHLSLSAEYKELLPDPSELDTIGHDPDVDEVTRLLVRGERPGRSVSIQVSIDEGLLARIDRIAQSRSRFLAEAASEVLANRAG